MTTPSHLRGSDTAPLNIDHNAVANFIRCRNINGVLHPYRIKRQLAVTRHFCKTIVNGQQIDL